VLYLVDLRSTITLAGLRSNLDILYEISMPVFLSFVGADNASALVPELTEYASSFATTHGIPYQRFTSWTSFSFGFLLNDYGSSIGRLQVAKGNKVRITLAPANEGELPVEHCVETPISCEPNVVPHANQSLTGELGAEKKQVNEAVETAATEEEDVMLAEVSPEGETAVSNDALVSAVTVAAEIPNKRVSFLLSDPFPNGRDKRQSRLDLINPQNATQGQTVEEMIVYMTHASISDFEFTKLFLMFYPRFSDAQVLMDTLIERFDCIIRNDDFEVMVGSQLRLCNLILFWAKTYWTDFNEKMKFSVVILMKTCRGCEELLPIAKHIMSLLQKPIVQPSEATWYGSGSANLKMAALKTHTIDTFLLKSKRTYLVMFSNSWIMDSDPASIACQITLLDWITFVNIKVLMISPKPRDLMQQIWATPDQQSYAASVAKSTQQFNHLSSLYHITNAVLALLYYRKET
jgi:RasGEF N-terminal motif